MQWMPSYASSVSPRSLERILMDQGCRSELRKRWPEVDVRFRQLDCFHRPGSRCRIFDAALELCAIDLEQQGFELCERGVKTKDGGVVWQS